MTNKNDCFGLIVPPSNRKRERLPRKPFYLIFAHYGSEKIGSLINRDEAIKRAKESASNNPAIEYAVMRAEIVITVKGEIEEITL